MIRPARDADRPLIAALHTANWRQGYRGLLPDVFLDHEIEAIMTKRWSEQPVGPRDLLLVAEEEGGALAGFVSVWDEGTPVAFIDNLHVAATGRSQGLGRRLLGEVAVRLQALGMTGAYLYVLLGNERARALYRALGGMAGEPFDDELYGHSVPGQRIDWPDVRLLAERCAVA